MKSIKIILMILIFLAAVIGVFFVISKTAPAPTADQNKNISKSANKLEPVTNEEGGLSITADPGELDFKNPQFFISFTTHEGDLDFDLTKVAVLVVDREKEYAPLNWDGGRGGHHLSGTLSFPPLNENPKSMKLIIKNIYGAEERVFEWNL